MSRFKVVFEHNGFKSEEEVQALNIFKAGKVIEEKYGKENVYVFVVTSTEGFE